MAILLALNTPFMSLNKDIQQKEFRNEYQKAILNIMYTHNYLVSRMTDLFKDYDITRQQYNVLRILRGQSPQHLSVNLIKDRMLDKMSDTSRIVERLRLKGFISRDNNRDDKRSVEIGITSAGLALLEKMEPPISEFEKLLHTLTPEETLQLNFLLDKLRGSDPEDSHTENESTELVSQQEKI
jgi:DNA-binding MarR family transcriptional regulator